MKIEIFSDFACPFCYIAKTRLYEAIEQLHLQDEVTIEYKAYSLNPSASKTEVIPYKKAMLELKGLSQNKLDEVTESIQTHASEVGLTFDFDNIILANTENAHRLSKLAKLYNKEQQFVENVMHRYFTEGLNLNDSAALLEICSELAILESEAIEAINTDRFSQSLAQDRYDAQQLQITSVPFFVFENRYGIKGVEPMEVFTKTLLQAKEIATTNLQVIESDLNCGDGGCTI